MEGGVGKKHALGSGPAAGREDGKLEEIEGIGRQTAGQYPDRFTFSLPADQAVASPGADSERAPGSATASLSKLTE